MSLGREPGHQAAPRGSSVYPTQPTRVPRAVSSAAPFAGPFLRPGFAPIASALAFGAAARTDCERPLAFFLGEATMDGDRGVRKRSTAGGGPDIAFRGGRVDAAEANQPGVPEPQQDLDSYIASFVRQGFTQTEMIGLVACGHTFCGVQHDPFPDIVPELNDPTSTESVQHFDTTNTHLITLLRRNISREKLRILSTIPLTATNEYLAAVGMLSTMLTFAKDPDLFASTCANLLARMLDTVPEGVQLTEVITPSPVKPHGMLLTLNNDTLELSGRLRVIIRSVSHISMLTSRSFGTWRRTRIVPCTFSGTTMLAVHTTSPVTLPFETVDTNFGRTSSAWYNFTSISGPFLALDPVAGITTMGFAVNDKLEDQGGVGFAVDDRVVFSKSSCRTSTSQTDLTARYDVAVRNGTTPTRVYLEQDTFDDVPLPIILETDFPPLAQPITPNAAYSIWSVNVSVYLDNPFDLVAYGIGAEIDGVKITDNGQHFLNDLPLCCS
ncbi:Peroxidase [Mycena venus]|uniref:Peroxidase n=1 Tax=Mycena venus TaxID=2733690 RepID=A0A8H6YJ98_9AGAR|nr:Peroxidase [Mycena venus]